jgi:hypothetical protein
MTRKPPTPPPDEDRIDRRTLPRERPWLSKPRPSRRTGAALPGAPRAARLSDLPKLTVRVPWTTCDRLTALAELRAETLGTVLAVAVTDYLTRLHSDELADVDRVQRRVQNRRLAAGKANR